MQEWLLWTGLITFGFVLVAIIFNFYFLFILIVLIIGIGTFDLGSLLPLPAVHRGVQRAAPARALLQPVAPQGGRGDRALEALAWRAASTTQVGLTPD